MANELCFLYSTGALIFVQTAAVFMYWPDLPRVSGAFHILSANVTHTLKLLNLSLNRDLFLSLIDFFLVSVSKEDLRDPSVLNIIISFEKITFRNIVLIFNGVAMAIVGLVGMSDLMENSGLPVVAWYPFDIQSPAVFPFVYLHLMAASIMAATLNVAMDMFSTSLIIQLCCRFELLKRDIRQMQKILPQNHDEISVQFQKIIDQQCLLKWRCSQLSQVNGIAMLGQLVGSIMIICVGFYQLYRASDTGIITLLSIMSVLIAALLQIFFYCYYGNELTITVSGVESQYLICTCNCKCD